MAADEIRWGVEYQGENQKNDRLAGRRLTDSGFNKRFGGFELSLRNQVKNPRAVNVAQDGGVAVSLLGTLLIDSEIGDFFLGTTQHAALHGTNHDGVDRAPGQSRKGTNALGGRTGLQQLDDKARHQGGDTAVTLSPGNDQLFDAAVAVFELGSTGFDEGLELAGVQVVPLPLSPAVDVGSLGGICGVSPHLPLLENHLNHHPLLCQRQVHRFHRPRCLQSKKLLVQRGVFHGMGNQFEKVDSAGVNENSQWNR
jgi:hypothetical protein